MKTCGPSPMVPSRAIPRTHWLLAGVGSHHPCCVLWAAEALFTSRLLSHTHPVSKLSEDRCYSPFKKNSREVNKGHLTAGKYPLGSMLSSRYTLLPPRYAGKVHLRVLPKVVPTVRPCRWSSTLFLLPKDYTLCHHFHTLLSRLSPPTLALRSYIASWSYL